MNMTFFRSPKVDETFSWVGGQEIPGYDGFCRIQIFCRSPRLQDSDNKYLVIASELANNEGISVTAGVEYLIPNVCNRFGIAQERTTWVEHYDKDSYPDGQREEEYSLVDISGQQPVWTYLSVEALESLLVETVML